MNPKSEAFSIYPSVIRADKKTRITVAPNERAYIFIDGASYQVKMIAQNGDEPDYYEPTAFATQDVTAHDGVLTFEHTFEGEGEHAVLLSKDGALIQSFTVYSLYEDLYELEALKGDLHSHSCRSDGTSDPASLFGHYRERGFDFVALTDHNRYYPGGEVDDVYAGVDTGIVRIFGEEVHAPGSPIHIVHVGGRESIADRYVLHRAEFEADVIEYMKKVPASIPEKFRERYAKAMLVTDSIHEVGGLAIFPHPFWKPGRSQMYNVCDEFARLLLTSGMFDAYELIGGMGQAGNNLSVALWSELRAEGLRISVVGSSDTHKLAHTFNNLFTVCFAKANTNESVISAVKSGMSVAVETTGEGSDRHYRAYGSFRLVSYAQFLLKNYFPLVAEIGAGIGIAMRAYGMEECSAELVEAQVALLKDFKDKFFGRTPISLPSDDMKRFEDKWREEQLTRGPRTRGSSVDALPTRGVI